MNRYEPAHARCYCVAIAGVAVTAAGAGATMYAQKKQADAQKKALAANDPAAAYGSKMELPDYKSNVQIPTFDASQGASDLLANQPAIAGIAKKYTKQGVNLRNLILPGSSDLLGLASTDLNALGHGQVSQGQVDSANQRIAERTGGTFDPSNPTGYAGANPYTVANFTTGIGKQSQDNVNQFLSTLPGYEQLSQSFAYTPEKAAASAMDMLNARYNYVLGAGKLQQGIDDSTYNSIVNQIKANSTGDPQVIGARNDALTAAALTGITGQGQIKEGIGALQGLVGTFGKTPTGVTQYNTIGQATSAAPYAAGYTNVSGMGVVPQAAKVA